jgi:hypothetical protein
MLPIERRSNISEQENLKALREFRNKTSTKIYRALYDIESKLTEKRWIPILPGACKFLIATIQTTCATILGALAFVPGFFSENARSFGKHCFTHITHGLTNMCIGSAEVVAGPLLYVQEKALLSDLQDKSHEKLETGFKSVLLPQYSDLIIADAHFVAGPEKTQEGAIEFQD